MLPGPSVLQGKKMSTECHMLPVKGCLLDTTLNTELQTCPGQPLPIFWFGASNTAHDGHVWFRLFHKCRCGSLLSCHNYIASFLIQQPIPLPPMIKYSWTQNTAFGDTQGEYFSWIFSDIIPAFLSSVRYTACNQTVVTSLIIVIGSSL